MTIPIHGYIIISMNIKEVAERCGNSPDTVRRWCKKKNLKHTKKGLEGIIDVSEEDLQEFCSDHGIEVKGVDGGE